MLVGRTYAIANDFSLYNIWETVQKRVTENCKGSVNYTTDIYDENARKTEAKMEGGRGTTQVTQHRTPRHLNTKI